LNTNNWIRLMACVSFTIHHWWTMKGFQILNGRLVRLGSQSNHHFNLTNTQLRSEDLNFTFDISHFKLDRYTHYYAYTYRLSTWYSPTDLGFLGVGFALICFQRLSRPNVATQQCFYTTGTLEVRPLRSSRTKSSPPQTFLAHTR